MRSRLPATTDAVPAIAFSESRLYNRGIVIPGWVLATLYSLHLIATVVWVGGLFVQAVIVWPAARASLGPGLLLSDVQARWRRVFNPLAWLSLAVLIGTGMFQMSADPNYHGALVIDTPWSVAMVVKHIAALGMAALGAFSQAVVQPEIARTQLQLRRSRAGADPATGMSAGASPLERREMQLLWLNLGCALIVLICTAIATGQ